MVRFAPIGLYASLLHRINVGETRACLDRMKITVMTIYATESFAVTAHARDHNYRQMYIIFVYFATRKLYCATLL